MNRAVRPVYGVNSSIAIILGVASSIEARHRQPGGENESLESAGVVRPLGNGQGKGSD